MQTLSGAFRDLFTVLRNDVHEGASHNSEAGNEKVDVLSCPLVEELVMDMQDGLIGILRRYDDGYISF